MASNGIVTRGFDFSECLLRKVDIGPVDPWYQIPANRSLVTGARYPGDRFDISVKLRVGDKATIMTEKQKTWRMWPRQTTVRLPLKAAYVENEPMQIEASIHGHIETKLIKCIESQKHVWCQTKQCMQQDT